MGEAPAHSTMMQDTRWKHQEMVF